jgi:hypothetical protein
MAAGSRGDAAIFGMMAIALAFLLRFSRDVFSWTNIAFAGVLTSISTYILFFSSSQVSMAARGTPPPGDLGETFTPSILLNLTKLPELWAGVFGTWGLGWLDTTMKPLVWFISLSVFAALIFTAIRWFTIRQSIAFSLAALSLVVNPLYILTVNRLEVGQDVQPRYLLPLIGLLASVALFRTSSKQSLEMSRAQVWIIGFGLVIANALALNTNTRRYISGLDVKSFNLDNTVEWWWSDFPVSPQFVWIVGALSFALFLLSLWKLRDRLGLPGGGISTGVKLTR